MAKETPIGDRVYIDTRCDSYVWRGRVNGKSVAKTIRHPNTGAVAKTDNMTKTEAKRIGREMTTDAETGAGRYFPVAGQNDLTTRRAWELYMERDGSKRRTASEKKSHWRRHIEPALGDKLLREVTRRDCAGLIDNVLTAAHAKGDNGNAALNLQKNLKRFFNWCAGTTGYGATGLEISPMAAMKEKIIDVKLTQRKSRSLDEEELIWFFQAAERYKVAKVRKDNNRERSAQGVETLLRSMCRRADIYQRPWRDLSERGLYVPRTKQGYALLLPLTPSMRALIGTKPGGASGDHPIWGAGMDCLAHAIDDIRPLMTEIAREHGSNKDFHTRKFGTEHNPHYWSGHDFRDTGKHYLGTLLREDSMPQFPLEVREACLNHREKGIAAIYNSDLESPDYMLAQRRAAGLCWNSYLDGIKARALSPLRLAA